MKTIGIIITKAPLESNLVTKFLNLARKITNNRNKVEIFLISDGVWLAKKNQDNPSSKILNELIKKSSKIFASKEHLTAAGIDDNELIKNITLSEKPYLDIVTLTMETWDKVITI